MSIIWAIIIGFIVGLIAKFLMPGRDPGGFIVTAILGIVGALLATFLGQAMGLYPAGQSAGFATTISRSSNVFVSRACNCCDASHAAASCACAAPM